MQMCKSNVYAVNIGYHPSCMSTMQDPLEIFPGQGGRSPLRPKEAPPVLTSCIHLKYIRIRTLVEGDYVTMLAKQAWRLLSEPDFLCAKVLRARYYPNGRLLNAQLKNGSSYTWQSVMAGLQCFKKRLYMESRRWHPNKDTNTEREQHLVSL